MTTFITIFKQVLCWVAAMYWLFGGLVYNHAFAQPAGTFKDITFQFASIDEGRDFLTQEDDFTQSFSEFDLSARLHSMGKVTKAEFFDSVMAHITTFSEKEQNRISTILQNQPEILSALRVSVPDNKILFIKGVARHEEGAAYTRRNAVILPEGMLKQNDKGLERLVYHEIWHVISRYNPDLKLKLYAILGFKPCEVVLPGNIANSMITNPDAVDYQFCYKTKMKEGGPKITVVPLIFAASPYDDPAGKKPFFAYIQSFPSLLNLENGQVLKPSEVKNYDADFFGTAYFIHPEEISADHFSFIITGNGQSKNAKLTGKFQKVLMKYSK